jgi:hypothetical protein
VMSHHSDHCGVGVVKPFAVMIENGQEEME